MDTATKADIYGSRYPKQVLITHQQYCVNYHLVHVFAQDFSMCRVIDQVRIHINTTTINAVIS